MAADTPPAPASGLHPAESGQAPDQIGFAARLAVGVERFHKFLSYVSAFFMFVMIFPTVADVGGRFLFNRPIMGVIEFDGLLMVFIIYCGIAYAQVAKAHVRVSFAIDRLPPRVRQAVESLMLLASIVILVICFYAAANEAIRSYTIGEYRFGSTRFALWPGRTLVAFGFLTLLLQFIVDFYRSLVDLKAGRVAYRVNDMPREITAFD